MGDVAGQDGSMMRLADRSPRALVSHFFERLTQPRLDDLSGAVRRRGDSLADMPRDVPSVWSHILVDLLLDMGAQDGWTTFPTRLYWRQAKSGGRNSTYDRPSPQLDDRGEYLFDACWTRYPASRAEWIRAVESGRLARPRIVLACECEWATPVHRHPSAEEHAGLILDDFAKLVDAPARHRWLMCAWTDDLPFERVVELCAKLAAPMHPNDCYAILGWRADAEWSQRGSVRTAFIGPHPDDSHGSSAPRLSE